MFLTFMCGCVCQLLLNQHDDDDGVKIYSCTVQFLELYNFIYTCILHSLCTVELHTKKPWNFSQLTVYGMHN